MVYVLSDGEDGTTGQLRCLFSATTSAQTPINMAQHSYWNLRGHDSGTTLDHKLSISSCAPYPVALFCPPSPLPLFLGFLKQQSASPLPGTSIRCNTATGSCEGTTLEPFLITATVSACPPFSFSQNLPSPPAQRHGETQLLESARA